MQPVIKNCEISVYKCIDTVNEYETDQKNKKIK